MARIKAGTWRAILVVGVIVLILGMAISGLLGWFIAVFIILLAMAGGALLHRTLGPPTQ